MRTVIEKRLPTVRALEGSAELIPMGRRRGGRGGRRQRVPPLRRRARLSRRSDGCCDPEASSPCSGPDRAWANTNVTQDSRDRRGGRTCSRGRRRSRAPTGAGTTHREAVAGFTPFERRSFPTVHELPSERLADLFATSSDIAVLPSAERAALTDRIRDARSAICPRSSSCRREAWSICACARPNGSADGEEGRRGSGDRRRGDRRRMGLVVRAAKRRQAGRRPRARARGAGRERPGRRRRARSGRHAADRCPRTVVHRLLPAPARAPRHRLRVPGARLPDPRRHQTGRARRDRARRDAAIGRAGVRVGERAGGRRPESDALGRGASRRLVRADRRLHRRPAQRPRVLPRHAAREGRPSRAHGVRGPPALEGTRGRASRAPAERSPPNA